jgi:hypothetical protein
MPLVLGVGASRMCRSARLRVAWRTYSCAGRDRWRAYGVAADDPSLGIRPSQRGRHSSALRRLGTARRAGNDLLAHRHGEWVRPALEPFAMAACWDRPIHRWRCCSCPTGVSGRRCAERRRGHSPASPSLSGYRWWILDHVMPPSVVRHAAAGRAPTCTSASPVRASVKTMSNQTSSLPSSRSGCHVAPPSAVR